MLVFSWQWCLAAGCSVAAEKQTGPRGARILTLFHLIKPVYPHQQRAEHCAFKYADGGDNKRDLNRERDQTPKKVSSGWMGSQSNLHVLQHQVLTTLTPGNAHYRETIEHSPSLGECSS